MELVELTLIDPSPLVNESSPNYRLPEFPPPEGWVMTLDKNGQPLSRFEDDYWDYRAYGGVTFNFSAHGISDDNKRYLKEILALCIYHPVLFPGKIKSVKNYWFVLLDLCKFCDSNGVSIAGIHKDKSVSSAYLSSLKKSKKISFASPLFHRIYSLRNEIGYFILDGGMLEELSISKREVTHIQTPYIPPRIWSYQLNRLDHCLDDYLKHKEHIESAYHWILNAMVENSSLGFNRDQMSPFCAVHKVKGRVIYQGGVRDFFSDYGIYDLLDRWVKIKDPLSKTLIGKLTSYFSYCRNAALLYIACFSLQRSSEVVSLRADCFHIEKDEVFGDVGIITGETIKTDPDSDARWIVPSYVNKAVEVAASIARMRAEASRRGISRLPLEADVEENPYLSTTSIEPWAGGGISYPTISHLNYHQLVDDFHGLIDKQKIRVTEEEFQLVKYFSPNIDESEKVVVGLPWPLSMHQLRRTSCINMLDSDLVSSESVQWEMKHASREMTMYYGRNYSSLRFHGAGKKLFLKESYSLISRRYQEILGGSLDVVRPYQNNQISSNVIHVVNQVDERKLISLIKNGSVSVRETLLGFCLRPSCQYGGVESAIHCAGVDGNGPCKDAAFSRKNRAELERLKISHEEELKIIGEDSPLSVKLKQEIYAIEVYFELTNEA